MGELNVQGSPASRDVLIEAVTGSHVVPNQGCPSSVLAVHSNLVPVHFGVIVVVTVNLADILPDERDKITITIVSQACGWIDNVR